MSITIVSNRVFLNPQNNSQVKKPDEANIVDAELEKPASLSNVVQSGDNTSRVAADEIFERGRLYSEVMPNVQKQVNSYYSISVAQRKEEVSALMGVDIYA